MGWITKQDHFFCQGHTVAANWYMSDVGFWLCIAAFVCFVSKLRGNYIYLIRLVLLATSLELSGENQDINTSPGLFNVFIFVF